MKEFATDGELYDESLTRKTQKDAFALLRHILRRINTFGFATVFDVVCLDAGFSKPKNWRYATTHGWTIRSVSQFTINKIEDGRYAVYLGNPQRLLDNKKEYET